MQVMLRSAAAKNKRGGGFPPPRGATLISMRTYWLTQEPRMLIFFEAAWAAFDFGSTMVRTPFL